MRQKISLIIDGNYHFHKCMSVLASLTKSKFPETEDHKLELLDKYTTDLMFLIRAFEPFIEHLIFVKDTGSWRKDYYPEYKDNRKKARSDKELINWDNYFKINKEYINILKEQENINVSEISGAEGDDLICLWTKYLNNQGKNCVIISGDGDLKQLLQCSEEYDSFTIQYNPNSKSRKVFLPSNYNVWKKSRMGKQVKKDTTDIFSVGNSVAKKDVLLFLEDFYKKNNVELVEPDEVLLEKVLMGDKKDNVPAVIDMENKGKKVKFTKTYYNDLFKIINQKDLVNFEKIKTSTDFFDNLKQVIEKKSKTEINSNTLKDNFGRNVHLLELISDNFPDSIIEVFEQNKTEIVKYKSINKNSFFKDTKYSEKISDNPRKINSLLSNLF